MKILYIFPHPDDESFGPAAAMHQQLKQGHEVHLLTLTRGGATRQRHKLGLTVEEMGDVRFREMLAVKDTLKLSSMKVLDLPDNGLKDMDPREIEKVVAQHIRQLKAEIVVSYPVHGISGFHDHLIIHYATKRVFLELKDEGVPYLKRLAFFTLPDSEAPSLQDGEFRLKRSQAEDIDCIIPLTDEEREIMKACLNCYETYQGTIEAIGVMEKIGNKVHFEIFNETFDPPLKDLADQLQRSNNR